MQNAACEPRPARCLHVYVRHPATRPHGLDATEHMQQLCAWRWLLKNLDVAGATAAPVGPLLAARRDCCVDILHAPMHLRRPPATRHSTSGVLGTSWGTSAMHTPHHQCQSDGGFTDEEEGGCVVSEASRSQAISFAVDTVAPRYCHACAVLWVGLLRLLWVLSRRTTTKALVGGSVSWLVGPCLCVNCHSKPVHVQQALDQATMPTEGAVKHLPRQSHHHHCNCCCCCCHLPSVLH